MTTTHTTLLRRFTLIAFAALFLLTPSMANAAVSITQVKGPGNESSGAAIALTPDETFKWSARVSTDTGTVTEATVRWWSMAPSDPSNPSSPSVISSQGELPMTAQGDGSYAVSAPAASFNMTPTRSTALHPLYYAIRARATDGSVRFAPSTMGETCNPVTFGCDTQYWLIQRGSSDVRSYSPLHGSSLDGEPLRFTVEWASLGTPMERTVVRYKVWDAAGRGAGEGTPAMSCLGSFCSYQSPHTVPAGGRVDYSFMVTDADGVRSATPHRYGGPNGGPLVSQDYTSTRSGTVEQPPVVCAEGTYPDPDGPGCVRPVEETPPPTDPCVSNPASCQPVAPTPATVCRIDRLAPAEGTDGDRLRVYGQFSGIPEFSFRNGDTSRRALLDAYSDTEAIVYVPRFELRAAKTQLAVFTDCVVGTSRTRSGDTPFVYTTTNQPPVAVPLEQQVRSASSKSRKGRSSSKRASRRLDGTSSYDRDGKVVAYRWTLGRRVVSRKATTPVAGSKTRRYTLCVTDDRGAKGCKAITVKAKAPRTVKVTLNNDVLFGYDSSRLSAKGKTALGKLRGYMRQAQTVRVEGHASAEGSAAYNMALSKARATTVRKSLLTGLTRKPKTAVVARGESKPVASNATEAGRAKNRRVVITITLRK